jgi:hypothetical protein
MPGRVLAAIPMSTSQTSPWRGSMAVEDVQNLLLHFARRQHVCPRFLFPLAREELQVMPNFAQDRLWLALDFLKKYFLRAHKPS